MKTLNYFFAFIILFFVITCSSPEKSPEPDYSFGNYVSAYTSGVISIEAPILVKLMQPNESYSPLETEIKAGLFQCKPHVEGKAYWLDKHTIQFQPTKPLQQGVEYTVSFNLGEVIDVGKKYQKLAFSFSTIKQSFGVNFDGLSSSSDFTYMSYKGSIYTADVVEDKKVEQILKATYEKREAKIKWHHDVGRLQHTFVVDSLKRSEDETVRLVVKWDGSSIKVDNKGKQEVEIPALNVFNVLEARVSYDPRQHVSITFSDPLNRQQNLDGLITIEDTPGLKYTIEGNQLKVWPEGQLTGQKNLVLHPGIENALNYAMDEPQEFLLVFESLKPALKLIGKGVVVPEEGSLTMPFEAVSLKAVDLRVIKIHTQNIHQFLQENRLGQSNELRKVGRLVYSGKMELHPETPDGYYKWNTYKVNIGDYVGLEKGAVYRVELRFNKSYSLFNCGEENSEPKDDMAKLEEELALEKEQQEWDRPGWYSNYYYPPDYEWDERNNPCSDSYYYYDRFVSRNIFASNLGIIAKEGKGNHLFFAVTNLVTTDPEANVELQVFDFQGQPMATLSTNNQGFATTELTKKPFLLVAKKGNQTGYLRLDDGTSLSMSNFDVSGQVVQKGLKGFIYGERGVWRPGDNIYLTFILEDKLNQFPEGQPVIFKLANPKGQVVEKRISTDNTNGFYHFKVATDVEAPTGNWKAMVQVGNTTFTKRVKIETVKPNRLKISFKVPDVIYTTKKEQIALNAQWLHGVPAKSLATTIDLNLVKKTTTFKGYEKYSFTDPASGFYTVKQEFFKGKLDVQGNATIPMDFEDISNAPGMLKAYFTTKVFEQGGDFSINTQAVDVAPFEKFVGIKMPESEDNWYKTGTDYLPEVVVLDAEGKPASAKNIKVELYKVDWRWWWESGEDYLAHYVRNSYKRPVKSWKIDNLNGSKKIKLNVKYRNWQDNGRYLLRVKNGQTGHAAGLTFYMSRWGGWRAEAGDAATMLSVRTDKEAYKVGEKVQVTIPSSITGKALVSLEGGEGIKDIFWVEATDKTTTFTFDVKPEMTPNIFVHVSLIQPYGQIENDAPLRLYGVVPVLVEDPQTKLNPVVKMADELEPEKEFEVEVKEQDGREMTYTLAIVDEGLLDLTNFKTPDPHNAFYAREALGVKSWDMYDLVAGAYGARLEKAFAVGGDESLDEAGKKKVNRFKPVVHFAGPFSLGKGGVKKHTFTMPNYIGSVKAMVVAGNKGAFGNTEKAVKVRKGLMLLSTLPRVLGPGETVKVPVNVFAMKENVKKVSLSLETSDIFEVVGEPTAKLQFDEPGEEMAYFTLLVKKTVGAGQVTVHAKSGKEKASAQIDIEVRNPNPPKIVEENEVVKAGESWEGGITAPGMAGTNEAWVEVSGLPSLNLTKHLDYLIRYPHGCIEQVTSSVFPQLFLDGLVELSGEQKMDIQQNVKTALQKFLAFQLTDGGFSYWPGSIHNNDWGINYAGHFMLMAEQKGYSLPVGMKNKWVRYQRNAARNWERNSGFRNGVFYNGHETSQAYRLYTLALAGTPDYSSMNRFKEVCKTNTAKWRLAAAYLVAGQAVVAKNILAGITTSVEKYSELGGTYGSDLRDKAMILETLNLLKEQEKGFLLLKEISNELNNRHWLSTQTAAWCLYAASQYANQVKGIGEMNLKIGINGKQLEFRSTLPLVKIPAKADKNGKVSLKVENKGDKLVYARVLAKGVPVEGDTEKVENNLGMKVTFTNKNGEVVDPSVMKQGEDFVATIEVIHPMVRGAYEELALTTIFPSGWEILNNRLNEVPDSGKGKFEYQDIRDDRVYTYFDLQKGKKMEFSVQLNAAYEGKFYLPAFSCEAMYDNTIYARQPGTWVEVKK